MLIHKTAIILGDVELGRDVRVAPYAVISGPCEIGSGATIGSHVTILPYVRVGSGTAIGDQTVVGGLPQDIQFQETVSWVEIGCDTVVREMVTIHRSTNRDRPTKVGNRCYVMSAAHIAHDCQIGDEARLASRVCISGHVEIGSGAVVGAATVIHQFVRVGRWAMIGAASKVTRDILPFMLADGRPAVHYRLNRVGLRRAGINRAVYRSLDAAASSLRHRKQIPEDTDGGLTAELGGFATLSRRGVASFQSPTHHRRSRPG